MSEKICVLGVAGGSASGKTTIINKLQDFFGEDIAVISHDAYYKAHPEMSFEERSQLNYDHPDSFESDRMDIKIFVDTDADERLMRRIKRDMIERGRSIESIIEQYSKTVKPMHEEFVEPSKKHADIIIPRGGENAAGLDMLITYMTKKLQTEE